MITGFLWPSEGGCSGDDSGGSRETAASLLPNGLRKLPNRLKIEVTGSSSFKCQAICEVFPVNTILIVIILLLLFAGGGGYYGYNRYGTRGLGGVLGLVIVVLIALWLLGVLGGAGIR